jgi:hypothetical protein
VHFGNPYLWDNYIRFTSFSWARATASFSICPFSPLTSLPARAGKQSANAHDLRIGLIAEGACFAEMINQAMIS